jgi:hypothetical protein
MKCYDFKKKIILCLVGSTRKIDNLQFIVIYRRLASLISSDIIDYFDLLVSVIGVIGVIVRSRSRAGRVQRSRAEASSAPNRDTITALARYSLHYHYSRGHVDRARLVLARRLVVREADNEEEQAPQHRGSTARTHGNDRSARKDPPDQIEARQNVQQGNENDQAE